MRGHRGNDRELHSWHGSFPFIRISSAGDEAFVVAVTIVVIAHYLCVAKTMLLTGLCRYGRRGTEEMIEASLRRTEVVHFNQAEPSIILVRS